uniref:ATP synthase complex subunit 8 n=1 Tax=Acropyga donisthorpei TaxID=354293 RepID=A0A6G5NII9_9HYME|nr:ATP synthase F0 subunit 8 [Acropyga donisthorpei]
MPQMMPTMWILIFLIIYLIFILIISSLYFLTLMPFIIKPNKNYFNKSNKWIWKW